MATTLKASIRPRCTLGQSEQVLALPEHLGSFDQFSDSTDTLAILARFRALYGRDR